MRGTWRQNLFMVVFCAAIIAVWVSAYSQSPAPRDPRLPDWAFIKTYNMTCGSEPDVKRHLGLDGQGVAGAGLWRGGGNRHELWVNPQTRSWSSVVHVGDGTLCIQASGTNLKFRGE